MRCSNCDCNHTKRYGSVNVDFLKDVTCRQCGENLFTVKGNVVSLKPPKVILKLTHDEKVFLQNYKTYAKDPSIPCSFKR